MTTQVQLRRGSDIAHSAFVGAPAEMTVVTDDWSVRVHDGVTPGGHPIGGGVGGLPPITVLSLVKDYTSGAAALLNGDVVDNQYIYWNVPATTDDAVYVNPSWGSNISIFAIEGEQWIYEISVHVHMKLLVTELPAGIIAYGTQLDSASTAEILHDNVATSTYSHKHFISSAAGESETASLSSASSFINQADNTISWSDTYLVKTLDGIASQLHLAFSGFAPAAPTTQIERLAAQVTIKNVARGLVTLPPPDMP